MKYTETGGDHDLTLRYTYDTKGNLTYLAETVDGEWRGIYYTYDDDNRVTRMYKGSGARAYTYDSLGRVSQKRAQHGATTRITDDFAFVTKGTALTTQVESHTITTGVGTDNAVATTYRYTYDKNGNITRIVKIQGSTETLIATYAYDTQNRLKREDNPVEEYTYTWTYDRIGNIMSRTEYEYTPADQAITDSPTATCTYGYNTVGWEDLLESYTVRENGEIKTEIVMEYDDAGNPETYGQWEMDWVHGRQLAQMKDAEVTWDFSYNADGLRTERTNGTKTWQYVYSGSQLVKMVAPSDEGNQNLAFAYDADGVPLTVRWNGSYYYYVTNIQGDVIGITDSTGLEVVAYTYDAWGNPLSTTGTMATTLGTYNPLRYRGYAYDAETGFYYVSSRYYNPEIGRWINADGEMSDVGGDILGYNLFAYCMNNPVNKSDPSGNWPKWATIALGAVAAVAAVAVTVVTLGAAAPAAVCTLTSVAMSVGVSYGVASAAATVAVAATTVAAAAYAGDIAYSAVTGDSLLLDTVFQGNTDAYNTGLAITSIATAGMLEMAAQNPGVCFVAGTPILAACGYIAIEEIKAGDMVWAENPETGEKELKEVVQAFVNETTELIYIQVGSEEIVTTPEHPFYSPVKGWIAACKLRAGDILVLQNGKYVTVEKVQHEILEAPITVYNFEVEDFHTYYVGKCAVLVHNTCGGNSSSRGVGGKGWVGDKTWRENVSTVGNGGTITSLNGGVPTKAQAIQLINQSGGTPLRIEGAHQFPNPHNYTHINYVTSSGVKGTIKIFE